MSYPLRGHGDCCAGLRLGLNSSWADFERILYSCFDLWQCLCQGRQGVPGWEALND